MFVDPYFFVLCNNMSRIEYKLDDHKAMKKLELVDFCTKEIHLCGNFGGTTQHKKFGLKDMILNPKLHPEMPYRSTRDLFRSTLHWGQRKLFISELVLLTKHAKSGDTVLYIGAAPGTHIRFLIELFPNLKWVLYDKRPFDIEHDNVTIIQE